MFCACASAGGGITVNSCSEGIESPEILIEDGDITVTSTDDGINACGTETADGSLPGITINGGTVTLLNPSGRDADGIDSNGNIDINGGLVYISLVGDGSNCALDYGSENGGICRINGGTVVACGGSTMLETMSETSAQPSLLYAGPPKRRGRRLPWKLPTARRFSPSPHPTASLPCWSAAPRCSSAAHTP